MMTNNNNRKLKVEPPMAIVYQFPSKLQREQWAIDKQLIAAGKLDKLSLNVATWSTEDVKGASEKKLSKRPDAEQAAQQQQPVTIDHTNVEALIDQIISETVSGMIAKAIVLDLKLDQLKPLKDLGLVIETMRSMLCRSQGMAHPLQKHAEIMFKSKKGSPGMLIFDSDKASV